MSRPRSSPDPAAGDQGSDSPVGARVDLGPEPDEAQGSQPPLGGTRRGPDRPPVASFWRRLAAYLADAVVLLAVGRLLTRLALGPLPDVDPLSPEALAVLWPYYLLDIGITWLYFAALESSELQATLGKRVLGLSVADERGRRISFPRATGRYFGKALSALPLGLGFLMIFTSEDNQALHDRLASCLVLEARPDEGRKVEGPEPHREP